MMLKLTWKFSLFARNQKILPSNVLFLFGISCLEIQNFRSYKQHRKGFRISDPQRTQRRILNFWSSKNTTKNSEFLTPKCHRKGFSISDTPKIQNFWSPTMTHRRNQNFWSPTKTQKYSEFLIPQRTQEKIQNFWSTEEHWPWKDFHPPSNRIPNILSQKNIVSSGIGIPDHPNNSSEIFFFFSLWAQSSHKIWGKNHYWRILE